MDADRVKQDVLALFEYAHHKEDWVNPLADALDGIPAEQAAIAPCPEIRSIWQNVLHMTVWSQHIEPWTPGYQHWLPDGSTPPLPSDLGEDGWNQARDRLMRAVAEMRSQIESTDPDELLRPAPEGTTLFEEMIGRMIHNAYHIGQITMLRECLPAIMAQREAAASGAAEGA